MFTNAKGMSCPITQTQNTSHKISQYYSKINSISILHPLKISINSDPHSRDHLGSSLHKLLTLRLGMDSTERRSGEFFVTYVLNLGFGLCSKEEEDDDEPSKRKSTLILLQEAANAHSQPRVKLDLESKHKSVTWCIFKQINQLLLLEGYNWIFKVTQLYSKNLNCQMYI